MFVIVYLALLLRDYTVVMERICKFIQQNGNRISKQNYDFQQTTKFVTIATGYVFMTFQCTVLQAKVQCLNYWLY